MKKRQRTHQQKQQQPLSNNEIQLPAQLANLIRRSSVESSAASVAGGEAVTSLNQAVNSCQNRHIKELSSYVRAVCMRVGLGSAENQINSNHFPKDQGSC